MKTKGFTFSVLMTLLLLGFSPFAQRLFADFGDYQIILDRQLLGRPPPPPRRDPPPREPEPPAAPGWATEFRMTMITFDDYSQKLRVALQNVREPGGYLLIKGETYDHHNYTLINGDIERGQATIAFRGQPHHFNLESGPAPASENASQDRSRRNRPAAVPQAPGRPVRRVIQPARPEQNDPEDEAPQQSRFQSSEELQAHLENVQMDAIRTGKPPLPIPLTQDMDDQLVNEGVLPPQ